MFTRLVPASYRQVFAVPRVPALLTAFGVSYLGDAMSVVTVAWLAIEIAPHGQQGLFVGAAVAAYSLPGVIGMFAFARYMRRQPSRLLVVADCVVRTGCLGAIAVLRAFDELAPATYVGLLAVSSLLLTWGLAGRYTVLTELVGPEATLTANSLQTALSNATTIIGPGIAGVLVAVWGAGPLVGIDAATYAWLAVVALRSRPRDAAAAPAAGSVDIGPADVGEKAVGGLRLLHRHGLVGVAALTWFFYFLYGPVEVALPLHVSADLHRGAGLLGLYWALFGLGAAIGSLLSGVFKHLPIWPTALVIVAGWGLCLVPFGFDLPIWVTLVSIGIGGLIYGPYVPLTYVLFQTRVAPQQQAVVLAARAAVMTVADPVGTAFGGPLTAAIGASRTMAASGYATVAAAAVIGAFTVASAYRGKWRHASPEPPPH